MEKIQTHLKGDTGRLTATYLAIIMVMTLLFSSIIYGISASQFDRPLPPRTPGFNEGIYDSTTRSSLEELFASRASQARGELMMSLIVLNIVVLGFGAILSYILARKTLEPIEAAMLAQRRFVSDASHELRTPLTALQISNEVALRKKKLSIANARELIAHNLSETMKLRNLSESLLLLAKQNDVATNNSTVHINEVVESLFQTLRPISSEKRITLQYDGSNQTVIGDRTAITQILGVFLDNAIKYSPDSKKIEVSVETKKRGVAISVLDEGPGVSREHRDKVFERLYQIDESRSSQQDQGHGLGLAIASQIAKRCGYSLSIGDSKPQGAMFTLLIPSEQK